MQLTRHQPEITLFFDHLDFRLSADQCEVLRAVLSTVEGVTSVQIHTRWWRRQQLTAVLRQEIAPSVILRKMAAVLRGLRSSAATAYDLTVQTVAAEFSPAEVDAISHTHCRTTDLSVRHGVHVRAADTMPTLAERLRHWFYGTLATLSLGMAWVGLLVPGIPTIPFVLLTAHFALKSSPALRRKFLHNRTFGPMIRDWDEHRAIRRSVRTRAYLLTWSLAGITLFLTPSSIVLYVIIVTMSGVGLFLISRIPIIEAHTVDCIEQPPTRAADSDTNAPLRDE